MAQWHYTSRGAQAGPVETAELKRMAQSGQIQPNDMVWKDGMPEWVQASRVKGLFDPAAAPEAVAMAPVGETAIPAFAPAHRPRFRIASEQASRNPLEKARHNPALSGEICRPSPI